MVTEPLVSPQPPTWSSRVQQVWQQMTRQWQQQFQQAQQTYEQVQQRQAVFETQLEANIGKLATTVAHKEQQMKRQVKQFLIKTAEKL
jgi:exonuclease VII large subunit